MLTQEDVTKVRNILALTVPYSNVYLSTLGGVEKASIMIAISFNPKEQWSNSIFENSMHSKLAIDSDCSIKELTGWKTLDFRKYNGKTLDKCIDKLIKWIEDNKALVKA